MNNIINPIQNYINANYDIIFAKNESKILYNTINNNTTSGDISIGELCAIYKSNGQCGFDINMISPVGPGKFTNMSPSQKLIACGITSSKMTPQQVESAGLLTTHTFPFNAGTMKCNKAIVDDLSDIIIECHKVAPWFKFKIGNMFRPFNSISSGISRHCWGIALDINPGKGGNPWFSTIITGSSPGYKSITIGSNPWSMKKCPYNGGYDPTKCIWSWDHPVVQIFMKHGWGWGGAYGDVMHFSLDSYKANGGMGGR